MKDKKKVPLIVGLISLITLLLSIFLVMDQSNSIKAEENSEKSLASSGDFSYIDAFQKDPLNLDITTRAAVDAPSYGVLSAVSFKQAAPSQLGGVALDKLGKVWVWGWNGHGQLGLNKRYEASSNSSDSSALMYAGGMVRIPYFVDNDINIVQVVAGYHHFLALDDQGNVYGWGSNSTNQIAASTYNTSGASLQGAGIIAPIKIPGLPTMTKLYTTSGYLNSNVSAGEDVDGNLWVWGENGKGEHGNGNTTDTATARQPSKVPLPSGTQIVDLAIGGRDGGSFFNLIDQNGDRYVWGSNYLSALGSNSQYGGSVNTPTKVTPESGMGKLKKVSSNYLYTILLDENNQIWEQGYSWFKLGASQSVLEPTETITTPRKVGISSQEMTNVGYTPIPTKITAAERGAFFIDQYGRVWAIGNNEYYIFGMDPGLTTDQTASSVRYIKLNQFEQWPKTMGDGDTQYAASEANKPTPEKGASLGNRFGYGYDTLHPTIYDFKYCSKDDAGRILTEEGYFINLISNSRMQIEDISGNIKGYMKSDYSVYTNQALTVKNEEIPKVTPIVKPSEKSWIGLAGKEVPKVADIFGARSSYTMIDEDGNLYKWGYDGSGSMAWGWDYDSKYDTNGSLKAGLYDRYTYEPMFMRGSPQTGPLYVDTWKPEKKIYKSSGESEDVSININIPPQVSSDQLNITIDTELKEAKYVVIPYDPNDSNFKIDNPTVDQFRSAYTNGTYRTSDIMLDEGWGTSLKNSSSEYLVAKSKVNITDNCKIWVMTRDVAYSRDKSEVTSLTADNFYTDTTLYHTGENINSPNEPVYEATDDYVKKTSALTTGEDPDKYGIPLDKNGKVIENPTLGYDETTTRAYTTTDPEYLSKEINYYTFVSGQENPVVVQLDDLKYLKTEDPQNQYIHTFKYERDEKMWVTITYKGRYIGKTTDISPYKMDGLVGNDGIVNNQETVKKSSASVTKTLTRTPGEVENSQPVYFKVDGGANNNVTSDKKIQFDTISDTSINTMEVIIYYNQAEIYLRQVIVNPNSEVVVPSNGYLRLNNTDGSTTLNTYNLKVSSGEVENDVVFKKARLTTDSTNDKYTVQAILPEMYQYYGYRISTTEANHSSAPLKQAPEEVLIDYSSENKYYLTIYLEPTVSKSQDIPFYNWDYKLNQFGKIESK